MLLSLGVSIIYNVYCILSYIGMCVSTAVHVDDQQTTVYVYLQE